MIELTFQGPSGGRDRKSLGPLPAFQIAGNFVRAAPSGEILARYEDFHWVVAERFYTSYRCVGPVVIHFEDLLGGKTAPSGPFREIHTADGVMYCDDTLFARFLEETLLWHAVQTSTRWPILVIAAADAHGD